MVLAITYDYYGISLIPKHYIRNQEICSQFGHHGRLGPDTFAL